MDISRLNVVFACPRVLALLIVTLMTHAVQAQPAGTNPHGELSTSVTCNNCHSTEGWSPVLAHFDFDHNEQTTFPLLGYHNKVECASCHINMRFDGPDVAVNDCASCHVDVHQGTLSSYCVDCHNTSRFQEVDAWALHAQSRFPLTGSHQQVACISCHTDDAHGAYAPLDTACETCHLDDYIATTTLDHQVQGFSTQCEDCHTVVTWEGAVFEHVTVSGGFELLGAHRAGSCGICHRLPAFEPIFTATSDQDCYACHQSDYEEEHGGSGFSTNCVDCHTPDDWDDVTFEHDDLYFPIFSGEHRGEWDNNCQTCHTDTNNYMMFTCLNCHEHRQSEMDDEHRGIGGYVYDSVACLNCHPDGEED